MYQAAWSAASFASASMLMKGRSCGLSFLRIGRRPSLISPLTALLVSPTRRAYSSDDMKGASIWNVKLLIWWYPFVYIYAPDSVGSCLFCALNLIDEQSIDQSEVNINNQMNKSAYKLSEPLNAEGGKVFVNRLVHLFGLRSKVELSGLIGVSTGSIATWQTRAVLPYELAVRIHLATGISIEYLLFDEPKGDLNVMQYLQDPTQQPNYANIKHNISKFRYSLTNPAHYDGGSVLIERLVSFFKLSSKKELSELLDVSTGTLGTWHARIITPHELLCRIHLATGVSMHFLCFGKEWEDVEAVRNETKPASTRRSASVSSSDFRDDVIPLLINPNSITEVRTHYSIPEVTFFKSDIYSIDDGSKIKNGAYQSNAILWEHAGVTPDDALVIRYNQATYFINTEIKTVTKGLYLFAINDVHQIGELKQLPDGKVYFIDGDDKYQINQETTKVIGKVVSVLKNI
jgi:hypothetical protein